MNNRIMKSSHLLLIAILIISVSCNAKQNVAGDNATSRIIESYEKNGDPDNVYYKIESNGKTFDMQKLLYDNCQAYK